jgi:hypothetical protein
MVVYEPSVQVPRKVPDFGGMTLFEPVGPVKKLAGKAAGTTAVGGLSRSTVETFEKTRSPRKLPNEKARRSDL